MNLLRFLFGEDLFISYSRVDATAYAAGLASRLAAKGFSCSLDQWGTEPGQEIPVRVLRSLARSSMLVLVGSPGATRSAAVEREVRQFLARRRPIVPITVGGALEASPWFPAIAGASLSVEDPAALAEGSPSAHVLSRIESSFLFTRRNQRVRRAFTAAALGLLALTGVAGWTTRNADLATQAAKVSKRESLEARRAADKSAQEAVRQQKRARDSDARAQHQQWIAHQRTQEAQRQQQIAAERLRQAQSAELAAASRVQLATEPDLAALLAVESFRAANTFEARRALLSAVAERPRLEAYLLSPEQGREAAVVGLYAGQINAVWFSSDGTRVAARDWDHRISVWPVTAAPRPRKTLAATAGLHTTLISPDFRLVAGLSDGGKTIHVRPSAGAASETVFAAPADQAIAELAFSPDGKLLALGSSDGVVTLWDARSGKQIGGALSSSNRRRIEGSDIGVVDPVSVLRFSGDGKTLYWSAGSAGAAEVPSGRAATPLPAEVPLGVTEWSADGKDLVIQTNDGGLTQARLYQGKIDGPVRPLIENPPSESKSIKVAAISADGSLIAAGQYDGTIVLFDSFASISPAASLTAHSAAVTALAFSADGRRLVSASEDGTVILWQPRGGLLEAAIRDLPASSAAVRFTPDGKRLLVAAGNALLVADPERGALERPIVCEGAQPVSLAISPDGRTLAVGSLDSIYLADLRTRRCTQAPLQPSRGPFLNANAITALAFSPDGRRLASGGQFASLTLWDVARRRQQQLNPPDINGYMINGLAWSPGGQALFVGNPMLPRLWPAGAERRRKPAFDAGERSSHTVAGTSNGRLLAGSSHEGVYLWDLTSGRIVARFAFGKAARDITDDTVSALALSADGRWLAVGQSSQDKGRLSLFDAVQKQWFGDLPVPRGCFFCGITSLDISADGTRLAAIIDNELLLWRLTPEAWIQRACEIANRQLTEAERKRHLGAGAAARKTCELRGRAR